MTRAATSLISVIAVPVTLLSILAGCAAETPSATPKPSATSSPTPSASPDAADDSKARIVISGSDITVLDEAGATTLELDYATEPADAIGLLADALGEQSTSAVISDDPCNPQLDESSWGGLHLWSSVEGVNKPENALFYVTVDAATTAADLPIETPSGTSVGDSEQDARSTNIDAPSFDDGADLHYDIVSGDASSSPEQYYGAAATIADGEVTGLRSPVFYFFEC